MTYGYICNIKQKQNQKIEAMTTNYDNEATQYDNEATELNHQSNNIPPIPPVPNQNKKEEQPKGSGSTWKRAAAGAGAGLLIGGVATVMMGMKKADAEPGKEAETDTHKDELSHPEWVDDQVQVATSVNDNMSFGEAFAAARAEVGPGGCFEWHGNLYGTYTADEWNHMTAEQRAEYGDHFSWNHIDHSSSSVAQHSTTASASSSQGATAQHQAAGGDDIEVVSVNHTGDSNDLAQANTHHTGGQGGQAEVVEVSQPADQDIQILGVVHDNTSGANVGSMSVDGHEVIVVDVDGDMSFDYMAADINSNGQLDDGELVDIQGQGLTVNDLGGVTANADNLFASTDTPDCTPDPVYDV